MYFNLQSLISEQVTCCALRYAMPSSFMSICLADLSHPGGPKIIQCYLGKHAKDALSNNLDMGGSSLTTTSMDLDNFRRV